MRYPSTTRNLRVRLALLAAMVTIASLMVLRSMATGQRNGGVETALAPKARASVESVASNTRLIALPLDTKESTRVTTTELEETSSVAISANSLPSELPSSDRVPFKARGFVLESTTGLGVSFARVVAVDGYSRADGVEMVAKGEAISDANGRFEIVFDVEVPDLANVEPWRLRQVASAPITFYALRDGWRCVGNISVPLVCEGEREEITILMGKSGGADVRVIDASTELPIENVTVELIPKVARGLTAPTIFTRRITDELGNVSFPELAEGTYALRVKKLFYGSQPASGGRLVISASTRILHEVRLESKTSIFGTVVDSSTGDCIPLASIELRQDGKRPMRLRSDGRGTFTPEVFLSRLTTIQVDAPGYLPGVRELYLDRDATRELIRVELVPTNEGEEAIPLPVMVRGTTVADASGTPIPLASITLTSPDGRIERFKGDLKGRFSPMAWGQGTARIDVSAPGFAPLSKVFSIDDPDTQRLEPLRLVALEAD